MKKRVLMLNLLLMAAVFVGNYFWHMHRSVELKTLCTCGVAVMGLINLIYARKAGEKNVKFQTLMFVGAVLSVGGDYFVTQIFVLGAALFALGHVFYYVGQQMRMPAKPLDLIISAVLFVGAAAFLLFCPLLSFSVPAFRWVCLVYALIISLMAGKAVSGVIRTPCGLTIALAAGSVLFFFSDLMLVFDWFIDLWSWTDEACMSTYYPAQCLLALSTFLAVENKEK